MLSLNRDHGRASQAFLEAQREASGPHLAFLPPIPRPRALLVC